MNDDEKCYICNDDEWLWRDQTCDLNSRDLRRFREKIEKTDTLLDIVSLLNTFKDVKRSIRHYILSFHRHNCQYCPRCDRKASYLEAKRAKLRSRQIPSDLTFDRAYCHVLDIDTHQYKILNRLSDCRAEIMDIHHMVGMDGIKLEFSRVIKYLAYNNRKEGELMHIGIFGPPGHGKTHIAQLLSKAFARSGLLEKPDVFVVARRSDLIGKYCGHTAKNTTAMFDKARGGVIFIDEIYSLGNKEKGDVFTGECINTINQLLSERTDTLCIIAGYEKEADECFFSYNPGLRRRFPFRFVIEPYNSEQLVAIFHKLAKDQGWGVENHALTKEDIEPCRETHFDNAGGDMNNLLTKCIIAHYENAFLKDASTRRLLSRTDVERGITDYKHHKKSSKDLALKPPPFGMYA